MSTSQIPPPPPPPPPVSSSTMGSSSSRPSHPAWNSLVSDITMSEDEEGNHHSHHHHQQQQQPATNSTHYYKPSLVHNEDSVAASFLEYSQSSEEAYGPSAYLKKEQQRSDGNFSSGDLGTGSTSFRFREDLTSSNRVVRFASSSDHESSVSTVRPAAVDSPLQQLRNDNDPKASRRHRHHHHHQHRGGVGATNRNTFLSKPNKWVTQLAYSFRTPPPPKQLRKQPMEDNHNHSFRSDTGSSRGSERKEDRKMKHTSQTVSQSIPKVTNTALHQKSEHTPLLPLKEEEDFSKAAFHKQQHQRQSVQHGHHKLFASNKLHRHPYDFLSMAVAFLQDYEAGRPPTLASNVTSITPWHLGLYRVKYCTAYSLLLGSATLALFMSSAMEGPSTTGDSNLRMHTLSGLNLYALIIFATDLWIRGQFQKPRQDPQARLQNNNNHFSRTMTALPVVVQTRASQAEILIRPLCLFGVFLGLENLGWLLAKPDRSFVVLYSSIWKPIVLYYVSSKARHAMEALLRIARHVIRILVIEMVLILSFAAVACRLFTDFEPFDHLSVAWLSLFKLSTTVVNPSIWMPMYQKTHWSAIFFVLFIVVTVFYMHSLVLSVVFQTYIQAATEIHDRSVTDREDAIQLSFSALRKQYQQDTRKQASHRQQSGEEERSTRQSPSGIPMHLVREVLECLRPHYNAMKINALVEIFDTTDDNDIDYATFRTKIRRALNASIRTARNASPLAMSIELAAVVVAVVNFIYVILLTSSFSETWFDAVQLEIGAVITVAGLVELLMRANPLRVPNFTPMTRFNAAFDGLAIFAAGISCVGIGMALGNREDALEYILMGRAVDMVRVMRFFAVFRRVVQRSAEVLPALFGPVALIFTCLHIFVYLGMAFWGGAIVVGELTEDEITPLYDLNNFNSYLEGLVTMFQVLVVNDWHAIAEVFMHGSRCSNPELVYPFFIVGNLVGVSILLNVITAFFVEAFVYKLSGPEGGFEWGAESNRDFSIKTSGSSVVRRITSSHSLNQLGQEDFDDAHDADSEASSGSSDIFEFDVLEREGYDKIIQSVSGVQNEDSYARQVCNHLELFESLTPGREKVGYLVCCQQTMNRYGNRRFESEAAEFIGKMELHSLVSDMHGELLVLLLSSKESFGDRSLIRVLSHPTDPSMQLEVSATILRRHPALSLFVSRLVTK